MVKRFILLQHLHHLLTPGSFSETVDYVVAGGGGGGADYYPSARGAGGGGGAGGLELDPYQSADHLHQLLQLVLEA